MSKYRIKIGEVTHEVEVRSLTPPTAQVIVDGHPYSVNLDQAPGANAPAAPEQPCAPAQPCKTVPPPATFTTEGDVTAPMPGKLIKFLVNLGDRVEAGQLVCVLEAMKMENQLPAPLAGKVVEMPVCEGADVTQRTVLLRIEAQA